MKLIDAPVVMAYLSAKYFSNANPPLMPKTGPLGVNFLVSDVNHDSCGSTKITNLISYELAEKKVDATKQAVAKYFSILFIILEFYKYKVK